MAAEIKIKRTLLENARAVLDAALENPRELSVAVSQLLNKPMKAAVGVSLLEQQRSLYEDITETLFPLRNRVAHRGYRPTNAEADEALDMVIKLFDWFDRL
jgi:hypothetical protein